MTRMTDDDDGDNDDDDDCAAIKSLLPNDVNNCIS